MDKSAKLRGMGALSRAAIWAGIVLRLAAGLACGGGLTALAEDRSPATADLRGTWVGTFRQDSHETTGSFRLVLTVEAASGDAFSGTIDWPDNNDCRTAVEGSFDGKTLKWTETRYLRGDDVVLYGLYVGRFRDTEQIAGTWMDPKHNIYPAGPKYGTPGGTFVLHKQPPP